MSKPGGIIIVRDPNGWSYDGKSLEQMALEVENFHCTLEQIVEVNRQMTTLTSITVNNSYIMRIFGALDRRLQKLGYIKEN